MTKAANLASLGSNASTTGILPIAGGGTAGTNGAIGFKNRIINGNMVIDQRANGASTSVTTSSTYTSCDRWYTGTSVNNKYTVQQNAGSVTPPANFTNYIGITSLAATTVGASDYYYISQRIEGYNVADLGFGTSSAKTVTLSFWVRSSLTGTFSVTLYNANGDRFYPATYTISAANTWEQKSVTIAGDTSGTWATTNGIGLHVYFSLGMGSNYTGTANTWSSLGYAATGATSVVSTNGATFYLTGVQLEVGSVATNFDFRSYIQELEFCQRYYYNTMWIRDANSLTAPTNNQVELQGARHQFGDVVGYRGQAYCHPVLMRVAPTAVVYNPLNSGTTGQWYFYANNGASQNYSGGPAMYRDGIVFNAYTGVNVGTSGLSCEVWAHWSASAEL